jgi:glutathione peroxidase
LKQIIFIILFIFSLNSYSKNNPLDYDLTFINGKEFNLANYSGKTILIVNIATRCGYTSQLDGLEKIYKKYKTKDLVILGIPSNNFANQTPEDSKNIEKFCRINYGVTFPITKKMNVLGKNKNKLIKFLIESTNNKEISWNFEKFLINSEGKVIKRFTSGISPKEIKIKNYLKKE